MESLIIKTTIQAQALTSEQVNVKKLNGGILATVKTVIIANTDPIIQTKVTTAELVTIIDTIINGFIISEEQKIAVEKAVLVYIANYFKTNGITAEQISIIINSILVQL